MSHNLATIWLRHLPIASQIAMRPHAMRHSLHPPQVAALLLATYRALSPWLRDDKVRCLPSSRDCGSHPTDSRGAAHGGVEMRDPCRGNVISTPCPQELLGLLREHMGAQASPALKCAPPSMLCALASTPQRMYRRTMSHCVGV